MLETQKTGNKTNSEDISLNIRTDASHELGQDQLSEGVSVPLLACHTTPVTNVLWKPRTIR